MGIFDFDRAVDSTFSTAFGLTAKIVGITASGTFAVIRNAVTSLQEGRRIRRTELASKNSRRVWVSASVDKSILCLNDDPYFDDTETISDENGEPALSYLSGESELPESVIISGGIYKDRCKALIPFIFKSQKNNMPLVVIYNSDSELEAMIAGYCKVYEIISYDKAYCDIFAGLLSDDIVRLICDTIDKDKPKDNMESLLRALVNVVFTRRPDACVDDMASFPIDKLRDEIKRLNTLGVITNGECANWLADYDAGSSAKVPVSTFLNNLNTDFKCLFGQVRTKRANIKRVLNNRGVVMIDIGKGNSELAVKLLVNYFLLLDKNGRKFHVILDDLPIAKFPEFGELIRGRTYAINHRDFIASLSLFHLKNNNENNSDELFMSLMCDVAAVSIFYHNSMASCRKWSEYFGTYKKIKIQKEHTRSGGLFEYNRTDALAEHEQDLPRIRDLSIARLPSGVACVYRSEGIFIGSI